MQSLTTLPVALVLVATLHLASSQDAVWQTDTTLRYECERGSDCAYPECLSWNPDFGHGCSSKRTCVFCPSWRDGAAHNRSCQDVNDWLFGPDAYELGTKWRCPDPPFCELGATSVSGYSISPDSCSKCEIGKRGHYLNNVSKCRECEFNTFADTEGLTSCLDCPPGFFSNSGATTCYECPKGTFSDGVEVIEDFGGCYACSAGSYSGSTGSTTCTLCPSGKWSPSKWLGAPNFRWTETGADTCEICAKGTFYDSEAGCPNCGPGSYSDSEGSTTCVLCPSGKFQQGKISRDSATTCSSCPDPFHSGTPPGSTSCLCNPGYIECRDKCRKIGRDPSPIVRYFLAFGLVPLLFLSVMLWCRVWNNWEMLQSTPQHIVISRWPVLLGAFDFVSDCSLLYFVHVDDCKFRFWLIIGFLGFTCLGAICIGIQNGQPVWMIVLNCPEAQDNVQVSRQQIQDLREACAASKWWTIIFETIPLSAIQVTIFLDGGDLVEDWIDWIILISPLVFTVPNLLKNVSAALMYSSHEEHLVREEEQQQMQQDSHSVELSTAPVPANVLYSRRYQQRAEGIEMVPVAAGVAGGVLGMA